MFPCCFPCIDHSTDLESAFDSEFFFQEFDVVGLVASDDRELVGRLDPVVDQVKLIVFVDLIVALDERKLGVHAATSGGLLCLRQFYANPFSHHGAKGQRERQAEYQLSKKRNLKLNSHKSQASSFLTSADFSQDMSLFQHTFPLLHSTRRTEMRVAEQFARDQMRAWRGAHTFLYPRSASHAVVCLRFRQVP